MVWCESNSHHSVVCEVQEGEERDKVEPEELGCGPLEADHSVHNNRIVRCLNQNVR